LLPDFFILVFVLLTGVLLSILKKKLTVAAAITGGVLGIFLFLGTGWIGPCLMGCFFILGSAATSWKRKEKERDRIVEKNQGRRKTSQVLANGGAGAAIALIAFFWPQYNVLMQLLIASSFSSATADTLSSELGSVYGKRFYNILSFKKDRRGLDGVVSVEGFISGMAGSAIIAVIYALFHGWSLHLLIIIITGTIGNLADSFLGAALERKKLIGNDAVNFLNTVIGALAALLLVELLF
jgi:uncharacterized protein (TIGR00297 family)